ncbi:MAG: tRNA (guanosine(37)-N1)-methyltransferase TrmD [Bacteroidetes bacterium QS_8_68_15]|nr:MAG: tRNA (guanosine(37)-N1)-methyltransferase TrmD [Bacteroidetes bacterium QS_8_68_15]
MQFDLVTALPQVVRGPLESGILGRALANGEDEDGPVAEVRVHDLRDYGEGEQNQIDDYPFGGGGGMVLKPGPLVRCLEALAEKHGAPDDVIYLTPDGERFTQHTANRLSRSQHLVLVAGRYKGIDERVRRGGWITRAVSIGDYVLSGGELPALVLIDAMVRLQPGALGDARSALTDSFQDDLLGAPAYTRPASFRGMDVPAVLRSGDHERIARWRFDESLRRTRARRPDLLDDEEDAPDSKKTT